MKKNLQSLNSLNISLHRRAVREVLAARKKTERKGRRFNIYIHGLRYKWLKKVAGDKKADQERFLKSFLDQLLYKAYMNRQITKKVFDQVIDESAKA